MREITVAKLLSAAKSCGLIEAQSAALQADGTYTLSAAKSCGLIEANGGSTMVTSGVAVIRSEKLRPH